MMERQFKDSGIEWIGKIPETWEVKRLKNLCTSNESMIADGDWIESPDISDEGIRYYTTGNIGDGVFKNQGNGFISESTFNKLNCTAVYPGDLVFSRLNNPIGRACIIPNNYPICIVAVDNVIVRPDSKYDKRFLVYISMCPGYQETNMLIARGTTMQRMSRSQLQNVDMPIPPLADQQRIADYLDENCGEIDSLIALQEQMIEKLKAYKQSVITEAVTKGLRACEARAAARADLQSARNEYKHLQCETDKADYKSSYSQRSDCKSDRTSADRASVKLVPSGQMIEKLKAYKQSVITEAVTKGLDPNAKLVPSGIDWIGEIPEQWKVLKTKFIADKIFKGNGITKEEVFPDGDTPCVRYGEIYSKYTQSFTNCISSTKLDIQKSPQYFQHGDILCAGTGELVEEIGKSIVYLGDQECLAGGDIIVIHHHQNPSFLNYALNSNYAQTQKSRGKAKLKVVHISAFEIGSTYILLPPLSEQRSIASYLDNKCADIDRLIALKQQKIESLKDYKKSVIYEAVTGKTEI